MSEALIVDDSKVMREMVIACSARASRAWRSPRPPAGWKRWRGCRSRRFDFVVLDLNMPDIGGYEVIEFIRGQDKLRSLPILVVTTRGDDELARARAGRGRHPRS